MRLIDADALIEGLLEARHEETETTLKLVRFIRKQPTIEPNISGKMIDADKLKENIIRNAKYTNWLDRAIAETPTVEPKRGRWVEASTDGAVFCSECGTEWLSEAARYYNFCPICGARMEEDNGKVDNL